MDKENKKTVSFKLLIVLVAVLLVIIAVLTAALLWPKENQESAATPTLPQNPAYTEAGDGEVEEDPGIPLVTDYIVLSYPSELEGQVRVKREDLADGQQVIFTTDFTGEELELFRFSISRSGTDGYALGVLSDETAGELLVCMNVTEYSSGSWTPEVYAKLNAMQERVNDIIMQFHADPRFTATRS